MAGRHYRPRLYGYPVDGVRGQGLGVSKMPAPGVRFDTEVGQAMAKGNSDEFDIGSVLMRVLFSLAIVFLTFNPTGHSYYHWLQQNLPPIQPVGRDRRHPAARRLAVLHPFDVLVDGHGGRRAAARVVRRDRLVDGQAGLALARRQIARWRGWC